MELPLEYITSRIKAEILEKDLGFSIVKLLFIKKKGETIESYRDIDLFIVFVEDQDFEYYDVVKITAKISSNLTITTGKYVTIFPLEETLWKSSESQFVRNIKKNGIEL